MYIKKEISLDKLNQILLSVILYIQLLLLLLLLTHLSLLWKSDKILENGQCSESGTYFYLCFTENTVLDAMK